MSNGRFESKVVLITGGASGIGRSSGLLFAREGAQVVVVDVDEKGGRDTVRELEKGGGKCYFIRGDVTRYDEMKSSVDEAYNKYRRIDVLVTCAGVESRGSIVETTEEEWNRVIGINLTGTFHACKSVLPYMISQGSGAIVTMSSGFGILPAPSSLAYCASKGGVISFTKALALDCLKQNIRINCVAPGPTDTPLFQRGHVVPITSAPDGLGGRIASPVEIAKGIVYLASEDASYVSGTVLSIDGGVTAGYKRVLK